MKKALIICWFGPIPNYYKLWEYSCSLNSDYDFLLFTDQELISNYKNIKIVKIEMNELKRIIEDKLNVSLAFNKPYKFCDLRPAYGIIFDEYLKKYDYWGHCDLDQIFGKISDFIPDELISKYEKINHNGHFVLYKNSGKMNNMFKNEGSPFNWKEVFCSNENYAFDEYSGINMICKNNNVLEYSSNEFADIDKKYKRYKTVNHENRKNQIFVYENGDLSRYILIDNRIVKKDSFFYLHFQKKIPIIIENTIFNKKVVIGSSMFGNEEMVENDTFEKYNPSKNQMIEFIELLSYYSKKTKEFFKFSKAMKKIKIKQKKSK